MSRAELSSKLPEDNVRPVLVVMFLHIAALIGVVVHTGMAINGLGGQAFQSDNIWWNLTIVAWLLSLLVFFKQLGGPAYETAYWQYTVYALTAVTSIGVVGLLYTSIAGNIYTDVILFMRYSSDLVVQGQNPYTHSMLPAIDRYASVFEVPNITRRADGSRVSNISYPALSFLVFVPQRLLGISNINLTVVLLFILSFVFLIRETPYWLFTVTATVLFFNQYLVANAVFGNIDFIWIFPLLLGMHFWHRGLLVRATFAVGIAFAVKPIAWFIAPFTAIWLWRNPDHFDRTRTTAIALALVGGFAGFFLPNLPYIINAPQAWVFDVLSAAGSRVSFETRGTGLAAFAYADLIPIPTSAFRLILAGVITSSLAVYYRYFEELKWVAWVMPAFILWFNDRALFNYFITFIPIAYYAMLLNRGVVPDRPLIPLGSIYESTLRAMSRFRGLLSRKVDA